MYFLIARVYKGQIKTNYHNLTFPPNFVEWKQVDVSNTKSKEPSATDETQVQS